MSIRIAQDPQHRNNNFDLTPKGGGGEGLHSIYQHHPICASLTRSHFTDRVKCNSEINLVRDMLLHFRPQKKSMPKKIRFFHLFLGNTQSSSN